MSLLSRIYYDLKPFLPTQVRMTLRRTLARRLVKKSSHIWPINPAAAHPPADWPGWPEGKQFALVLTHDVESAAGVARCEDLLQLETGLGFRSGFNFIPEGSYRVTPDLRERLTGSGFEVGVHDLKHDGKLYRCKEEFLRNAGRINRYLKDWNAVGFRSGLMHHNLEWLHTLDIEYDLSTFDTDPFEPQPDAADTIFPFFVPGPETQKSKFKNQNSEPDSALSTLHSALSSRPGYLELPYTLPQDSTLFLILQERTTAIWKQKLDWIASRGGMALLNVHPDYMSFDGQPPGRWQYPARLYREFLQHIRARYENECWFALPREVAAYCRQRPVAAQA